MAKSVRLCGRTGTPSAITAIKNRSLRGEGTQEEVLLSALTLLRSREDAAADRFPFVQGYPILVSAPA